MYLCEPMFWRKFNGKHHFGNFKVISHWHPNIPLFNSFGKHFFFDFIIQQHIYIQWNTIIQVNNYLFTNTQTNKVFILSKWKFIYWDCQFYVNKF